MLIGVCRQCKVVFRKREAIRKFCSLKCANSFNINGIHNITLPSLDENLAEFIGICLGDGCTQKYQTTITLNKIVDREYSHYVENLAKKLFTSEAVSLNENFNPKIIRVCINSKIATDFLKKHGIIANKKTIPNWILENQKYRKHCIRGLFDTEGSISYKLYLGKKTRSLYKQLNFRNADIKLMQFVRDTLLELDFRATTTLKRSLYLSSNKEIDRFRVEIGFSNAKLEKRSKIYDYEQLTLLIKQPIGRDAGVGLSSSS